MALVSILFSKGLTNINESVEIDLQMLCECECEKPHKIVKNSAECHNAGTFACGICAACNGNRTGAQCECDPEKPIDPKDPDAHCKHKGNEIIINKPFGDLIV